MSCAKVLVVGAQGNMGQRYSCILERVLGRDRVIGVDVGADLPTEGVTHAVIATPTPTHLSIIERLGPNVQILCEKPVAKQTEFPKWDNVFMVNNYSFAKYPMVGIRHRGESWYQNWKTGGDGAAGDLIQLLHLATECFSH
jgi:hypothetical protein